MYLVNTEITYAILQSYYVICAQRFLPLMYISPTSINKKTKKNKDDSTVHVIYNALYVL